MATRGYIAQKQDEYYKTIDLLTTEISQQLGIEHTNVPQKAKRDDLNLYYMLMLEYFTVWLQALKEKITPEIAEDVIDFIEDDLQKPEKQEILQNNFTKKSKKLQKLKA